MPSAGKSVKLPSLPQLSEATPPQVADDLLVDFTPLPALALKPSCAVRACDVVFKEAWRTPEHLPISVEKRGEGGGLGYGLIDAWASDSKGAKKLDANRFRGSGFR